MSQAQAIVSDSGTRGLEERRVPFEGRTASVAYEIKYLRRAKDELLRRPTRHYVRELNNHFAKLTHTSSRSLRA